MLTLPGVDLRVFRHLDHISRLRCGDNLCLGESLVEDLQAEVIVWIVMGDIDRLEVLPQTFDLVDQCFGLALLELSIDEHSVLLAIDDRGGDLEDGVLTGVKNLHLQS